MRKGQAACGGDTKQHITVVVFAKQVGDVYVSIIMDSLHAVRGQSCRTTVYNVNSAASTKTGGQSLLWAIARRTSNSRFNRE